MSSNNNSIIIELVEFMLKHFDYFIFDFDNTITKLHLANLLERDNWEKGFDGMKIEGYISNPKFFRFLIKNIIQYPNKKFFLFTHGNNERGIRFILEKGLGKEYSDKIIILAGRDEESKSNLDYLVKDSLNQQREETFRRHKKKEDMFDYVEEKFNIKFNKNNTIFFDDTEENIIKNCYEDEKCSGILVPKQFIAQGMSYLPISDGFNDTHLSEYLGKLKNIISSHGERIRPLIGHDIFNQQGGRRERFLQDEINTEIRVRKLFRI